MKKILKQISAIAVLIFILTFSCAPPALALTDGDWEFQLLDNEVMITGYIGKGGDVVIPETIYGVPVTKIEISRHSPDLSSATSIVFPASFKETFCCGFSSKLETVILPENLESISDFAFYDCENLKTIKLPSTIKSIRNNAFYGCENLSEINLPEGLTSIGSECFSYCGLESIETPLSLKKLGNGAFSYNWKLKSVKINTGIEDLLTGGGSNGTFENCRALENVELPNTLVNIGSSTFEGCTSLKNIIFPISLKEIGYEAFSGCAGLTEVVIPYGVKSLDEYSFARCSNLKSLYIPNSVISLSGNVIDESNNCIIYCGADSHTAAFCKFAEISHLTDNSVNSGITVLYNGTRISFHAYGQNPELLNSRTLVPLRSIFEAMGAEVEWDGATSTAIAKRDGITIRIQIGAGEIYKDDTAIPVDVPAQLVNDRTMVPVRVIAEAFGADVQWNDNGKTVLIYE